VHCQASTSVKISQIPKRDSPSEFPGRTVSLVPSDYWASAPESFLRSRLSSTGYSHVQTLPLRFCLKARIIGRWGLVMAQVPMSDGLLTVCDQEPIHIPGAIQSFGFLLSVNADWMVARASENVEKFIGVSHAQVVGQSAESCLSSALLHEIRSRLQVAGGMGVVERLYGQRLTSGGARFDIAIHQSGREVILEFEPSGDEPSAPLATLRTMALRVERQSSAAAVYREVARQVRGLTGFDRVMVYRFDEDGTGEVVAETCAHGLTPYLGLRYPASDIPAQARALYEKNFLRIIADVDAVPASIIPTLSPEGDTLDLTMSGLRSVSPVHIEYLKNMGVQTSMSISVLRGGRLWGLIACHHGTVRHINLEIRSTAELFGQMFSYLLESRERLDDGEYELQAQEIHNRIAVAFSDPAASLRDIPEFISGIDDFITAGGIGVYCAGEVNLSGITPTRDEFVDLVRLLNKTAAGRVFSTHKLSEILPAAANYAGQVSGVLSIPISRTPRDYLVFFRRELVQTVTWAGQPEKVGARARLTPRKSFEAWQEIVRNRSERWSRRELRAAESLRVTLIELVLRMSENAEAIHKTSQQSQEVLIAELNHRVRNILGLVRGLVNQSASTASDIRVFVSNIDQRIGSLARAHDLLSSNNGTSGSFHDLLRFEIETYSELESRLVLVGPDILLLPKSYTAMALVCHELVTNARKYGALSNRNGIVTVETSLDELHNVLVSWKESGGPLVAKPTRRGFGSTLIEQLIPFEMNGLSKPQFHASGFVLDVLLPASMAEARPTVIDGDQLLEAALTDIESASVATLLHSCLVVEDNLFIALDVEDMLRSLGGEKVVIASSIAEAQTAMAQGSFSFALLDVNLGAENSLPVARRLLAGGVPIAFGTGYGETFSLPDAMANTPILSKPYHRVAVLKVLAGMVRSNAKAPLAGCR
jgi:light-regulated signal transduction histidine kinase (bacteriophytochrome)